MTTDRKYGEGVLVRRDPSGLLYRVTRFGEYVGTIHKTGTTKSWMWKYEARRHENGQVTRLGGGNTIQSAVESLLRTVQGDSR